LTTPTLLRLDSVSKTYGGVHALEDVSLSIGHGEVHAICGENGAGKSTLIKILTGVVRADHGTVLLDGARLKNGDVHAAENAGIAAVHQESTAFPDLNVVDNLFVGREIRRGWSLDYSAMRHQAASLMRELGESIDLDCPISHLPLAQRQMVSIARALVGRCRLLIMDEPTASLSARETQILLTLIQRLRGEGISVLYISHRLEEVFSIADRITVLRDGRWIETRPADQMTRESLIELMVGRKLFTPVECPCVTQDERSEAPLLEVRNLLREKSFRNISLQIRAGEVLGLGGLVGAGRSEVAKAIFGIDPYDEGEVLVERRRLRAGCVRSSLAAGLALVPEDRQHEGLILPLSIRSNVSLAILRTLRRFGCIQFRRERQIVKQQLSDLMVKHGGIEQPAATLSGGNQQKLVLGKWLAARPKILIVDEPTRGIDVGAKVQFHELIRNFARQGMAILLISSELPELLALSDRVLVMRQGSIVAELSRSEATQASVLELALPDGTAGGTHA
jgi:rhamnose transport system ATP-binding protein